MNAIVAERPRSVLVAMAHRFDMEPAAFEATVRATCIKPDRDGRTASREEFAAFLLVAKEYELNPLTKEIHAFMAKGGGVVPVVGIDGWSSLINRNHAFDGMEFADQIDERGQLYAVTCRMYRKDRSRPIETTEYMVECRRETDVWKKWPRRMLRHKAMIQAARYAFGFSGIFDPDEAERVAEVEPRDITPRRSAPPPPPQRVSAPPTSPAESHDEDGVIEGEILPPEDIAPPKEDPAPPASAKASPMAMDEDAPAERGSPLPRLLTLMAAAQTEADADDVYANEEKAIASLNGDEEAELAAAYEARLADLRGTVELPNLPLPPEDRATWKAECFNILKAAKRGSQIVDWWQGPEHKQLRDKLGIPASDRKEVVAEGERLRKELGE